MRHRISFKVFGGMMLMKVVMMAAACGAPPPESKPGVSQVQAVPAPAALLSLVTVEIQDGLAAALPEGACVTKMPPASTQDAAETWQYDACAAGAPGVSLSGERRHWSKDAAAGSPARSRFSLSRTRIDGAVWEAEGQTEMSARLEMGGVSENRALMHGTMTPSGERNHALARHVYAYHLRITEGLDGARGRRLSGVAQINFATLEATSQVKLVSLIFVPECAWPVSGHVSVATTAGDGSFLDTALVFSDMCGWVKDDQGNLTNLMLPWEEGG